MNQRPDETLLPCYFECLEARVLLSGDAETPELLPQSYGHPNYDLMDMRADPSRDIVYIVGSLNEIAAFDTDAGRIVKSAALPGQPSSLAINTDDTELYVTMKALNEIQVFSLPDLTPLRLLNVTSLDGISVGFGNKIYLTNGTSAIVRILDGQSGASLGTLGVQPNQTSTTSTSVSPDGKLLFAYSNLGDEEYDISGSNAVFVQTLPIPAPVIMDQQYNRLYFYDYEHGNGVYDLSAGTKTFLNPSLQNPSGYSVDFNPNSSSLWSCCNGNIYQFDRQTGQLIQKYPVTPSYIRNVQVTPNGHVFFYSSTNNELFGMLGLPSIMVGMGAYLDVPERNVYLTSAIGDPEKSKAFAMKNTGELPVTITRWQQSENGFRFSLQDSDGNPVDTSKNIVVEPGETLNLIATLTTTTNGSKTGHVSFNGSEQISVSGCVGYSTLGVSVGSETDCRSVEISRGYIEGESSSAAFHLTNTGNVNLEISGFTITGQNKDDYDVSAWTKRGKIDLTNGPLSIAPGDSCDICVSMPVLKAGPRSADIVFNTNDKNNPIVTLSVTSNLLPPTLVITDDSGDDSDRLIAFATAGGSTVVQQKICFTNTGDLPAQISGYTMIGNFDDFLIQTTPWPYMPDSFDYTNFWINPDDSATIYVTELLLAPGKNNAQMCWVTNDETNPAVTVNLTGDVLPSVNLAVQLTRCTNYTEYVPGDRVKYTARVTNVGSLAFYPTPSDPCIVEMSLPQDSEDIESYDFPLRTTLAPGASVTFLATFTLPQPGDYDAQVVVDATNVLSEPDCSDDFADDWITTQWAFGEIPGRTGSKTLSFVDCFGKTVSISLQGGGYGIVTHTEDNEEEHVHESYGDIYNISIIGSTTKSRLGITTSKVPQDAKENGQDHFNLTGLTVGNPDDPSDQTSLGAIVAPTTDVYGKIVIPGQIGSIRMGNMGGADDNDHSSLTIGEALPNPPANASVDLSFSWVVDFAVKSAIRIKSLTADAWEHQWNDSSITAPSLGTLVIRGTDEQYAYLECDLKLAGPDGGNSSIPTLGRIKAGCTVGGYDWDITGNIGSIEATNIEYGWTLHGVNRLQSLKVKETLDNSININAGSIGAIVSGEVLGGTITAQSIDSITTTGYTDYGNFWPGDFGADLTLSGSNVKPSSPALRSVKIGGQLYTGIWNVWGPIGSIVAASTASDWNASVMGEFGNIGSFKIIDPKAQNDLEINALSIGTLAVAGSLTESHVTLSQTPDPKIWALTKMSVSGKMVQSELRCAGNIQTIVAGELDHSNIFAGVLDSVTNLPASGSDFDDYAQDKIATIRQLKITGISGMPTAPAMAESNVAAGILLNVSIPKRPSALASAEAGDSPFGFAAKFKIGTYTGPAAVGDFVCHVV